MDKQKVYVSKLGDGRSGLFTKGHLVFSLTPEEASNVETIKQIADRCGFELVQNPQIPHGDKDV